MNKDMALPFSGAWGPVLSGNDWQASVMFNTSVFLRSLMKYGTAGIFCFVLAAILITSGCLQAPAGSPVVSVPTETPLAPIPVPTPVLETAVPRIEFARLQVDHFGLDPTAGDVYEFLGKVSIGPGAYNSVKVIVRYNDGQEYSYDAGAMGGSNVTIKPFFLYPGDHYRGQNPQKIIQLDNQRYGTVYRYENGIQVWVATRDNPLT